MEPPERPRLDMTSAKTEQLRRFGTEYSLFYSYLLKVIGATNDPTGITVGSFQASSGRDPPRGVAAPAASYKI
jgi:hypothetical protein